MSASTDVGKRLNTFREAAKENGKDIYVPTKTNVLEIFDFRAFLNMAMLLSESDKARALRQLIEPHATNTLDDRLKDSCGNLIAMRFEKASGVIKG